MFSRWEKSVLHAPEDPPGGPPPAATEPPKTFTQDDLNAILAKERKSAEAKTVQAIEAARQAAQKEADAKLAEQAARLEELENKGKSAEERERLAAEKAAKAIQAERDSLSAKLAEHEATIKAKDERIAHIRNVNLVTGLYGEAKGLPTMLRHAIPAILADIQFDFDETDKATAARIDGLTKTPAEAIKHWLSKPENDGFLAHAGGGSGGNRANGTGGIAADPNASAAALIAAGLREGT